MRYSIAEHERRYLRGLARRQAEIAALPVMEERRRQWMDVNDGKAGARPTFVIETSTFDRDFMPASLFRCESGYGRKLEAGFLRNIRHHEILDDDHVCPDTLDMQWHVWCNEFGVDINVTYAKDAEGIVTGYHFDCPIKDLRDGFEMIRPATFGVDRDETMEEKCFLEETFGDILPVAIRSGTYGNNNLTQRLLRLLTCSAWTDLLTLVNKSGNRHCIMWRHKATDVVCPDDLTDFKKKIFDQADILKGCSYQVVLRELQTLLGHGDRLREWTRMSIEAVSRF